MRRDAPFPVPSRRSRSSSRRSLRMPHLVRLALLAGATCAAIAIAPSPATADVARLEPVAETTPSERSPGYQIVVTDLRGARRTLGPVPNGRLFAGPGGRHLALVPNEDDQASPLIAPLDGSPPRSLELPPGTQVIADLSQLSWTADGTELLIGDAVGWDPAAFPDPSAIKDPDSFRWTTLRCPLATGICSELPDSRGLVVGVPDGVLTTSSFFSTFPTSWTLGGLREQGRAAWEPQSSKRGRVWAGIANDVRVTSTQLVGPPPKVLGRARRPGSAGIPVAYSAVSGPAGAVISRLTVVAQLEHRRGRLRLKTTFRSPRFLLARPGVPLRALPNRPMALSHRDARQVSQATGEPSRRWYFRPQFGTADGWLGAGGPALLSNDLLLTTMDVDGRARPVMVRGRPVTPRTLLRAAHGRTPGRPDKQLELVGHEAAGNAIVTVHYRRPGPGMPDRSETLRVPLDGKGRPTVIRGTVDVAW